MSRTLILLLLSIFALMNNVEAKKKVRGGSTDGGAEFGSAGKEGAGLRLFTSPEAIAQAELVPLNEFRNEPLRMQGKIQSLEVNPESQGKPEDGEIEVGDFDEDGNIEFQPDLNATEVGRRVLNVFLPDTRTYTVYNTYPARTVGLWGGCTATLVYDSAILLTNAHCLNYNADGSFASSNWNTRFYAGFQNGFYLGSSTAKAIWYDKSKDYAAIKLYTALDATVGRMGVYWEPLSYFAFKEINLFFTKIKIPVYRSVNMISYSGDHCTSWTSCASKLSTGLTRGTLGADVKHDLDGKRGSSGSTVFQWINGWPIQVAYNWGEYRNGGEVSLTLPSYTDNNPNVAKPSDYWKPGYDKVKVF